MFRRSAAPRASSRPTWQRRSELLMTTSSISSAAGNTALTPLPTGERLFGWSDHAALWLSLGVGLLVMQIGAYLVPALGTQTALAVIVCGSILGAGLLAW